MIRTTRVEKNGRFVGIVKENLQTGRVFARLHNGLFHGFDDRVAAMKWLLL